MILQCSSYEAIGPRLVGGIRGVEEHANQEDVYKGEMLEIEEVK